MIRWVAASCFLVGIEAWGMTLRSEPVIMVALTFTVFAAIRFRKTRDGRILIAMAVAGVLSATAHPAGLIAAVPLIAITPDVWDWTLENGRERVVWLAAVTASVVAVGLLLYFVDTDLASKLASISEFRSSSHQATPFDELDRYRYLGFEYAHVTFVRRASVALIPLGVLGYLTRPGRRFRSPESIPAVSLALATALLAVTPSKWIWHFGGLIGVTTIAVALEISRVRRDRAVVAITGAAFVFSWAWSVTTFWNLPQTDLVKFQWVAGGRNVLPLDLSSPFTWLALGVGLHLVGRVAPWIGRHTAAEGVDWFVLLGSASLVLVTLATFAADAVIASDWSFGRQNIEAIWGAGDCGLGSEIRIPVSASLVSLPPTDHLTSVEAQAVAMEAGYPSAFNFETDGFFGIGVNLLLPVRGMQVVGSFDKSAADPNAATGRFLSSWYALDERSTDVALMVVGGFNRTNSIAVQWGEVIDGRVENRGITEAAVTGYYLDWGFIPIGAKPPRSTLVRLLMRDNSQGNGGWIASSQPLGYESTSLASAVEEYHATTLIWPLDTSLYFPCLRQPEIGGGLVEQPALIVTRRDPLPPVYSGVVSLDRYMSLMGETAHRGIEVWGSQEYLTGIPAVPRGGQPSSEESH